MTRKLHRIPKRALSATITVEPEVGVVGLMPADEEPITIQSRVGGRFTLKIKRQMHAVRAMGLRSTSFGLFAVDDPRPAHPTGREYQVGNVHTNGGICFGGVRRPDDVAMFDAVFWMSPFNADLSGGNLPGWNPGMLSPQGQWNRHYAQLQSNPATLGIVQECEQWATRCRSLGYEDTFVPVRWSRRRWERIMPSGAHVPHPGGDTWRRPTIRNDADEKWREANRIWKRTLGGTYYLHAPRRFTPETRQALREGTYSERCKPWGTLLPSERKTLLESYRGFSRRTSAVQAMDEHARTFDREAKAIGVRCGKRGLSLDARTKGQREKEADLLRAIDRFARFYPEQGERLRQYWRWLIEWHVATGKVQQHVANANLKERWLEERGLTSDTRKDALEAYYSGAWRARDPETDEPTDGRLLNGGATQNRVTLPALYGTAFYTGPRCDCVFLSDDEEDLQAVPQEYRLKDIGTANPLVGAFGVKHPQGGWALAFPHRTQPGRFWRARWAGTGNPVRAF